MTYGQALEERFQVGDELVQLVVVQPVAGLLELDDAGVAEMLDAAIPFGVRGPAVGAVNQQSGAGDPLPQFLNRAVVDIFWWPSVEVPESTKVLFGARLVNMMMMQPKATWGRAKRIEPDYVFEYMVNAGTEIAEALANWRTRHSSEAVREGLLNMSCAGCEGG